MKAKTPSRELPEADVRLVDLDGVNDRTLMAITVTSRTNAVEMLRLGAKAITAADDTGAINVYVDDDGLFRCEFMRHRITFDAGSFRYLAAVDEWLRRWWPEMSNSVFR